MASDNRKSAYAITVYPESTDIDLLKMYLSSLHIACAMSPLHDRDVYNDVDAMGWDKRVKEGKVDPEESERPIPGAPKKPHYHVVLSFGRAKRSVQQILEVVQPIVPSCRWVEPVASLGGYTRYLCHLDDEDKYTYSVDDVWTCGHYDLSPLWEVSKADKRGAVGVLCDYAKQYGIYNHCDLVDVVRELDSPALLDCVVERSFFFSKYLEGLYAKSRGLIPSDIDPHAVADLIRRGVVADAATGELREVA